MKNIENIDELISKYLSGNAQPEEAMLLDDWRNNNPDNELYFLENEKVFNAFNHSRKTNPVNQKEAWDKIKASIQTEADIKPINNNKNYFLKIAASLVLLIGLGILFTFLFNKNKQEVVEYTAINESQFIKLNDNTEVELNKNSKLILNNEFGQTNRRVFLNGNAEFNVKHIESLPFIVDVGNFYIKDIGTKFSVNLSLNRDTVSVNVTEGEVILFDSLGANLDIKAPGEAIYIYSKKQLIRQSEVLLNNLNIKFNDTRLSEVILKLNKEFNTLIVLENADLNNCTITTVFTNENLETIITIITETLGLSYEKTTSGYLIKGKKCQS